MQRIIVTGANGVGKSHVAHRLHLARPDVPIVSFDAIKLTQGWQQRPRPEIDTELAKTIATEAWILEGGPSLLDLALPRAEAVLWLDPPEMVRAWRLLARPWRHFGKTRPELPPGNVDWPTQQYRFALNSLKNRSAFRNRLSTTLDKTNPDRVWRCCSQQQIDKAVGKWKNLAS